jgi:signal transduction histidine kinase
MFDILTGKQKILETINATVSHEMRNPLSSIMSQQVLLEELLESLNKKVDRIEDQELKDEIKADLVKLEDCKSVMKASTKQLNYVVNDMLVLAQLNSGKFRQNISRFNIVDAVNEVLLVFKLKAEHARINVTTQFSNFEEDMQICSDA